MRRKGSRRAPLNWSQDADEDHEIDDDLKEDKRKRPFNSVDLNPDQKNLDAIESDTLFMNKKKLSDIEGWFLKASVPHNDPLFLALVGPCGSGKTFTIERLALKHKINLIDGFSEVSIPSGKQSKYRSLDFGVDESDHKSKIVLYDNFCSHNFTVNFFKSLIEAKTDAIFLISEPVSNEKSCNLWFHPILSLPCTTRIETYSFSKTILTKALKSELISEAADLGDMRAAIILNRLLKLEPKKSLNPSCHLYDKSLNFFHALGKILYPRKSHLDFDTFHTDDLSVFNSYLHHNVPNFVKSTEKLSLILDSFSFVDCTFEPGFSNENWKSGYLTIPSRQTSMVVSLDKNNSKGFFPMTKPPFISKQKNKSYTF